MLWRAWADARAAARIATDAESLSGIPAAARRGRPAVAARALLKPALEQDASLGLTIATPSLHDRDHRGRNGDVAGFRTGFLHGPQCHDEFRRSVDTMRARYDLV